MPTAAQRKKMEDAREFFRLKYAGRIGNVSEHPNVRQEIQQRFEIDNNRWYYLRDQLEDINRAAKGRVTELAPVEEPKEDGQETQGEVVEQTLEIPHDLPQSAKDVINRLLEINSTVTQDLAIKDMEIAGLRNTNATMAARIRVLKKIHFEAVEAL